MRVKLGVIGVGMMGRSHASIAATLPNAELVAVADTDQKTLKEVCGELGAKGYADYGEMLDKEKLDAVVICTPDRHHREPAEAAAERGVHLLVEKPTARTVEDARAIIASAKKNGVVLMTAHLLRFDPSYALAYEAIRAGEIGDIVHMYARRNDNVVDGRRLGGRTTLPFYCGVHDFDIMNWFTGEKAERVSAISNSLVMRDLGVYDSVFANFTFTAGIIASWESTWVLPENIGHSDMLMEIGGTKGVIYIDAYTQGLNIITESRYRMPDTRYGSPVHGRLLGALREQLIHFVACITEESEPLITPADALEAVRMGCAIDESLEKRGAWIPLNE
jgi:predicted dehydrogenase